MTVCSEQSTSSTLEADKDEDYTCTDLDHEIVNCMPLEKLNSVADCEIQTEDAPPAFPFSLHSYTPKDEVDLDPDRIEELNPNIFDEMKTGSSDGSSNGCGPNQNTDDSFMLEGPNGASQVQSWQFMDDEHSCDCISQSLANPIKVVPFSKGEKITNQCVQNQQESNHNKLSLLDLETEDSHYTKTLSAVFRNSRRLIAKTYFHNGSFESSFMVWRKDSDTQKLQASASQKMLKKILLEVAWMHDGFSLKTQEEVRAKEGGLKFEGDDIDMKHVYSERKRREKLNEKFLVLRTLVPSVNKVFFFLDMNSCTHTHTPMSLTR